MSIMARHVPGQTHLRTSAETPPPLSKLINTELRTSSGYTTLGRRSGGCGPRSIFKVDEKIKGDLVT